MQRHAHESSDCAERWKIARCTLPLPREAERHAGNWLQANAWQEFAAIEIPRLQNLRTLPSTDSVFQNAV